MLILCEQAAQLLRSAVAQQHQGTQGGTVKSPRIVKGPLPAKRAGVADKEEFPYIEVLPAQGWDSFEEAHCDIHLFFGSWANDEAGWQDCLNALNRCRTVFEALPGQTLGMARLDEREGKVIEWDLYMDQPYPQWMASMIIHFVIRKAQFLPGKDEL